MRIKNALYAAFAALLLALITTTAGAQVAGEYVFGYSNSNTPCYLNVFYSDGSSQKFSTGDNEILAGTPNQGHWVDKGVNYSPGNSNAYSNYTVGTSPSSDNSGPNVARAYFTFDLIGLKSGITISSANLQVTKYTVRSSSGKTSLPIVFGSVTTDASTLNNRTSTPNLTIFNDLGRSDYGAASVAVNNGFDNTTQLQFALNGSAIAAIGSHSGQYFSLSASAAPVPELNALIGLSAMFAGAIMLVPVLRRQVS